MGRRMFTLLAAAGAYAAIEMIRKPENLALSGYHTGVKALRCADQYLDKTETTEHCVEKLKSLDTSVRTGTALDYSVAAGISDLLAKMYAVLDDENGGEQKKYALSEDRRELLNSRNTLARLLERKPRS